MVWYGVESGRVGDIYTSRRYKMKRERKKGRRKGRKGW